MRLRLNTTLRAALIAAISTFAMATTAFADVTTGTQTFGAGSDPVLTRGDTVFGQEWYVTKDMTAGTATANLMSPDNAVNIWGGDLWAGDYTVSLWVSKDTLAENRLLFAYAGSMVTGNLGANGIYWDASAKKITIGQGKVTDNYTNFSFSNNKVTSDVITLGDDNSMVNITFAVQNLNDGQSMTPTIWVNGVSAGTLNGYGGRMNGSKNPMNLYVGSGVTYGNVSITNETLTTQDQVLTLMGLSKTEPAAAVDYVWKGTESGVWDTATKNWETKATPGTLTTFVASADNTVTFNASGSKQAVSLAADTTIGSVTVDGAAYTLDLDGHTLTTDTLAVAGDGASLALTGEGTVAAGSIAAADKTINIDEKVVLTGEGSGTLAGKGTYALASGSISKGSIVLGGDWTGVVSVSDVAFNGNFATVCSNLSKEGSWIELKGTSGWLNASGASTTTYAANLILSKGTDDWAFKQDNGNDRTVLQFTGTIKGDGNFGRSNGKGSTYTYEFTGDIHEWTGQFISNNNDDKYTLFKVSDKATVVAATLVNNRAGAKSDFRVEVNTNATFTSTVQATSLTVNDGKSATFSEAISIAKDITVGTGATLNVNGGGSIAKAITNNDGTVSLSGITLGNGFEEIGGEDTYVAVNGTTTVTDEDNYYLGNARGYVTVVTGSGEVSGSDITWNDGTYDLQDDGTITTTAAGTNFDTFYINKGSEQISDILAHNTTAVQVNAGTLVVNQDATGVNITVTEFGAISGDYANAAQVGIASEALAQYTQDVEVSGVKFTPADVTDAVLIYNAGEQTKVYGTDDSNMSVSAKKLEMTKQDGDVTVSNAVYVDEIVNTTTHALTLDNVEDTLELVNMDITNSTVKVYTNLAPETEATVSISGVLQGGDATLLANLTLVGGADSMLDVDGGGLKALTLGSTLAIDTTDGLVNLDQDTIDALAGLSEGQSLNLIVAADQTKLNYGGSYDGVSYDTLFSATGLTGPYTVYANEGSFGLVKGSQVPEPTTGTLSLLALAALAARRRRK